MSKSKLQTADSALFEQFISSTKSIIKKLPDRFKRRRKMGLLQVLLIMQAAHFNRSVSAGQSWDDSIEDVALALGTELGWGENSSVSTKSFHVAKKKPTEADIDAYLKIHQDTYVEKYITPRMSTLHGIRFLHCDGTQIRTGRSDELIEAFGVQTNGPASTAHYPNIQSVTLMEAGTHRIIANQLSRCKAKDAMNELTKEKVPLDERAAFEEMRPILQENDCVLADSGFASYEILYEMQRAKQLFVMAVPKSWNLVKQFRKMKRAIYQITYQIPKGVKGKECIGKTITVQVVRMQAPDGSTKYLATNLPSLFTVQEIRKVYKTRWAVETFFRTAKDHLSMRRLRSQTLTGVKLEIMAIMLFMQTVHSFQAMVANAVNLPMSLLATIQEGYLKTRILSTIKLSWAVIQITITGRRGPLIKYAKRLFNLIMKKLAPYIPGRTYQRKSHDPDGLFMKKRKSQGERKALRNKELKS